MDDYILMVLVFRNHKEITRSWEKFPDLPDIADTMDSLKEQIIERTYEAVVSGEGELDYDTANELDGVS